MDHPIVVNIAGRDYTLSTTKSEEKARRVAAFVDRTIAESTGVISSREVAAVTAALSIAEQLLDAQDDNQRLRNTLYKLENPGGGR